MNDEFAAKTAWALDDESRWALQQAIDEVEDSGSPSAFLDALEQRGYTITRVQDVTR